LHGLLAAYRAGQFIPVQRGLTRPWASQNCLQVGQVHYTHAPVKISNNHGQS